MVDPYNYFISGGGKAYDRLIPAMDSAGLSPGDEAREVYLNWAGPDAADNQILVAVGVRGERR